MTITLTAHDEWYTEGYTDVEKRFIGLFGPIMKHAIAAMFEDAYVHFTAEDDAPGVPVVHIYSENDTDVPLLKLGTLDEILARCVTDEDAKHYPTDTLCVVDVLKRHVDRLEKAMARESNPDRATSRTVEPAESGFSSERA